MGRFIFGAIAILVAVGAVFIFGVIVGGSWNAGMEDEANGLDRDTVSKCLPAEHVDELEKCLNEAR